MVTRGRATARDEPAWLAAERQFEDEVLDAETVPALFEASVDRHGSADAQLYKGGVYDRSLADSVVDPAPDGEFAALSYDETSDIVRRLAAGFRDIGIEAGDRVGILANTRMEWAQTDLALLAAGAVVTTVYTESSPRQVRYLLDDPGATAVVVENEELLDRVLSVEGDLDLSAIVVMDAVDVDRPDVYALADVYERGATVFDEAAYRGWIDERDPEDLASLIYTSGTTARPKGVRLTHANFVANVGQVYRRLGPRPDKDPDLPTLDEDTTSISFLPLAHVFERLAGHFTMFGVGATVGYAEHPDTLAEDLTKIRPTMGASVPRVYERVYDRMRERASESALKERVFEWAVGVAREWARTDDPGLGLRVRHAVADRLVYGTVQEGLGGNVEFMVSGGGSLAKELCETFVGMGVTIVEGYGLTETAPVVSVNPVEDVRPGTMGVPVVDQEVRIDEDVVDPSDFEDATGDLGELLLRGPNVTDGYWEDPAEDERAFDEADDGGEPWFRTGDIVEYTPDGYLVYRDRRKEVLVLSTGKNVAPQPIEDAFATNDRVEQVMVVGDERKFVGALIVPNFERLARWAEREGIDLPAERAALCRDERVEDWVGEAVDAVNAELDPTNRIKDFALVPREWTTDDDLLTPSLKKKRRKIRETFSEELERIYDEG